jgi:hypothetical protein
LRGESKLRVFENRVLKRIFGQKRDEVTGEWRKLHNKELNDLYSSPSSGGDKIEKNEMGRAYSMYGGEERCVHENLRVRDHWGDPGVDGRIILRWIFRKWDEGV